MSEVNPLRSYNYYLKQPTGQLQEKQTRQHVDDDEDEAVSSGAATGFRRSVASCRVGHKSQWQPGRDELACAHTPHKSDRSPLLGRRPRDLDNSRAVDGGARDGGARDGGARDGGAWCPVLLINQTQSSSVTLRVPLSADFPLPVPLCFRWWPSPPSPPDGLAPEMSCLLEAADGAAESIADSIELWPEPDELLRCRTGLVLPWHLATKRSSAISSSRNGTYASRERRKSKRVITRGKEEARMHATISE
uniref:Uncharacterized protein n=1 Tax=Anopheles atroparvus TaxID=41427 RepID=A0A182J9F7_ANOAO